jgi:hypothetical protein
MPVRFPSDPHARLNHPHPYSRSRGKLRHACRDSDPPRRRGCVPAAIRGMLVCRPRDLSAIPAAFRDVFACPSARPEVALAPIRW